MFYVTADRRLLYELLSLVQASPNFKNSHIRYDDGKITIRILSGFPNETTKLTEEQIERGVCGGGFQHGLDGRTFEISVDEVSS